MAAQFHYTIEPTKVAYSAGERKASVVSLMLTATNRKAHPVTCRELLISIPTGSTSQDLTEDASPVVAAPDAETPWAVCIAGDGLWRAVPLPPSTGLVEGQRVGFVFSNIVVNRVAGPATITIEEQTILDGTVVSATEGVVIDKDRPTHEGGDRPVVLLFEADPVEVAWQGNTTLSWRVDYALTGVLEPLGITPSDITKGSVTVPMDESTVFTLVAIGAGGSTQAPAAVTVMPVAIESFRADLNDVPPHTPVELSWVTRFANECSIDQGVGPVPRHGRVVVKPARTTIYTLRADGLEPRTAAITVVVLPPYVTPDPTRQEML